MLNLHVSDLAHTLLAFLQLLEKLLLTGDIAAVALREDILSHGSHRLTANDLATHSGLDRNLEYMLRISSFSFSHIFLPRS